MASLSVWYLILQTHVRTRGKNHYSISFSRSQQIQIILTNECRELTSVGIRCFLSNICDNARKTRFIQLSDKYFWKTRIIHLDICPTNSLLPKDFFLYFNNIDVFSLHCTLWIFGQFWELIYIFAHSFRPLLAQKMIYIGCTISKHCVSTSHTHLHGRN